MWKHCQLETKSIEIIEIGSWEIHKILIDYKQRFFFFFFWLKTSKKPKPGVAQWTRLKGGQVSAVAFVIDDF